MQNRKLFYPIHVQNSWPKFNENFNKNKMMCLCTQMLPEHMQFANVRFCTMYIKSKSKVRIKVMHGSRGVGAGGTDPPEKSQVIWVSIGNKQLDPLEKVGPP